MYWVHSNKCLRVKLRFSKAHSEPEHHKLYFTYLVSSIENILWPSFQTYYFTSGLPRCCSGQVSICQCRRTRDRSSIAGSGDPQEEEMATHSNILAWEIPWTEEPGGLQFMGYQRVGHNWAHTHTHTHTHTHRKHETRKGRRKMFSQLQSWGSKLGPAGGFPTILHQRVLQMRTGSSKRVKDSPKATQDWSEPGAQ